MTRLADFYLNREFGQARHHCEVLFKRMLKIYKPTTLTPTYALEYEFYYTILEKYFYPSGKHRLDLDEIFGSGAICYEVKNYEFILLPDAARFGMRHQDRQFFMGDGSCTIEGVDVYVRGRVKRKMVKQLVEALEAIPS